MKNNNNSIIKFICHTCNKNYLLDISLYDESCYDYKCPKCYKKSFEKKERKNEK